MDRDLAEIATIQTEHTRSLERIEGKLIAHDGRFDSMDSQLRSLTQLVGQVLERLPEPDDTHD